MRAGDPITSLAAAIHAACLRDLPDVEYRHRNPGCPEEVTVTKRRRPRPDECGVYQFPQVWGSTALGFGGLGGQAITTADTTIVSDGRSAAVYFGGRLAYVIERVGQAFWDDVRNFQMADKALAEKYEEAV